MVPSNRYEPMLAKLVEKPFDDPNYIYERKLDGIRCIVYLSADAPILINRSGNIITDKFPEIYPKLKPGYTSAVLDGELVCLSDEGVPLFQRMQTRMNRKYAITKTMVENPASYIVFDILELDGKCLCNQPLYRRKTILDDVLQWGGSTVQTNPYQIGHGLALLKDYTAEGGEGIMAKTMDGLYCPGKRGPEWLKMKARKEITVYVGALTQGFGRREDTFGALMVGTRPNPHTSRLIFIGEVGTGYTDTDLVDLYEILLRMETEKSPFINEPPGQVMMYVKPSLKVNVTYLEMTNDGIMRHAAFKGVVSDRK